MNKISMTKKQYLQMRQDMIIGCDKICEEENACAIGCPECEVNILIAAGYIKTKE